MSSSHLTDQAVTNAKLATSAVDRRTIAPDAVDGSRLRNRAVSSGKLVNPGFSASVNEDGTPSTARSVGVDLSLTRKTFDGIYSVGFQEDIRNCSFAATAVRSGVTADVTRVPSNTHVVSVQLSRPFLPQGSSSILPLREDGAFSLIVQC